VSCVKRMESQGPMCLFPHHPAPSRVLLHGFHVSDATLAKRASHAVLDLRCIPRQV
jgi:hypothetical protein